MKVRVVPVEPKEGGNVGAAARVMKNFGWRDLVIAGPAPDAPDEKSVWWAAGAEDVLRDERYVTTLDEALADVHMSVATTAVRARHVHEQMTPAEVALVAGETLADDERLALVFGRETWGLTANEIAACQRTTSVPTSSDSPTMNLPRRQSFLLRAFQTRPQASNLGPRNHRARRPHRALNSHTQELLIEMGFFADKPPDRMCAELKRSRENAH